MDALEIRNLTTPEDALRYSQLASIAFHSKNERLGDEEAYKEYAAQNEARALADKTQQGNYRTRTGLFQDGKLLSAVTANAFEITFDGNLCQMCGIGGVMSDPSARRTGGVSRVLRHELAAMKERGQVFSHLYPFLTSFYRKFGYTHCAYATKWTIPLQFLPTGDCGCVRLFENTPLQQQEVRQVYAQFAGRYNLAVDRSDARWEGIFKSRLPYTSGIYSYLHYGQSGPDAFLSYRMPSPDEASTTVKVIDLYFATPDALRQMLIFLGQLRSYASELALRLPQDANISGWLTEMTSHYGKLTVKQQLTHMGASRVVDAEAALRLARYRGKGEARIRILDPLCSWNDKAFHVVFDERCLSIRETDTWDVSMDICDFSCLILGGQDFSQHPYLTSVEVRGNLENLEKIFYRKPLWIGDSF